MKLNPVEMIARRRENSRPDTDEELQEWIRAYTVGEVPDYQMAAWLMAVCFHGLTVGETATLTRCLAESGVILSWPKETTTGPSSPSSSSPGTTQAPGRRPPLVDKHSSGGVGDKVSLILAPLVACCGVGVPMMAGRGLGHTGGTIDKLESLRGYRTGLSVAEFRKVVGDVGCAIVSAGPELAPADQKLYALRDVTATVSSLPLQTASIMSKKIAEGPDSIVLDVKYGHGAFQSTAAEAQALAESMVAVGEANGLNPTTAFLTDMNHPIGSAVGNWLEVKECIDVMSGNLKAEGLRLSHDLIELVCVQAGQMLFQSRPGEDADGHSVLRSSIPDTLDACIEHTYQVLDSGRALGKFREMALAQGADPVFLRQALENPDQIPLAAYSATWKADTPGYVLDIPAKTIGNVGVMLGAGRTVVGQDVDAQAGLVFGKKVGDVVAPGDTLVTVYTNQSQVHADEALECVQRAIQLGTDPPSRKKGPIVTHRVTKNGGTELYEMPCFFG